MMLFLLIFVQLLEEKTRVKREAETTRQIRHSGQKKERRNGDKGGKGGKGRKEKRKGKGKVKTCKLQTLQNGTLTSPSKVSATCLGVYYLPYII